MESRVRLLDQSIVKIQESDEDILMSGGAIPDDLVIYKYVNDSLQSWCNQFSVLNDDISAKLVFHRLSSQKNTLISPLSEVTEELSYLNLGPKWYIVKAVNFQNSVKVIAGIEIQNTLIRDHDRAQNGVNPLLRLPRRYSIVPLSYSYGTAVSIGGKPLFKVVLDTDYSSPLFDTSLLRWFSLLFFALAAVLFLASRRTMKTYALVIAVLTVILITSFVWGYQMEGFSSIFSPTLYADGPIFFSLGALLLLNAYITLVNICTYLVRRRIQTHIRENERNAARNVALCGAFFHIAATPHSVLLFSSPARKI